MNKEELDYEASLIGKAQANPDAFSDLYDRYYYRVFMFCYRRTNDRTQAADLCSQTFLKAMLHLKNFVPKGAPFSAWLFRIASNEINQAFRHSKKLQEVPLSFEDMAQLAGEVELESREDVFQILTEALNNLGLEDQQLIELRFFEQYSFAQIAEVYDISEANAKMKVYRILKQMKASIESRKQP